jgi:hypothetical protein
MRRMGRIKTFGGIRSNAIPPYAGFINVRYLFNGDRLAFVKGYPRNNARQLKAGVPSIAQSDDQQKT